jgi:5-methyltetrahydrofolate--homocysteine methyltransferase
MNKLTESILKKRILISDGATGTNLQQRGLKKGKSPEAWVLEKPEEIFQLEKDFLEAGSDILLTCTFGASSIRLKQNGLDGKTAEINKRAVQLVKQAIGGLEILIGGSMGPLGHMLKPYGELELATAKSNYEEQAAVLANAGIDFFVIETQYDMNEVNAAIESVQKVCSLPIVCSFSYDRGTRTMMGVKPGQTAQELEKRGITAIGINCGKSLEDNYKCLIELRQSTSLPIWFKPNAGLPKVDETGSTLYSISPEEMGGQVNGWIAAGATIIGGCCGTSPAHLNAIAKAVNQYLS